MTKPNPTRIRTRRAIPIDLSYRHRRQLYVMAARNGVSMEAQVVALVSEYLGI